MDYPIKTLSQLQPILRGFRKAAGLSQAAMAERMGITQQSYAHFEANPTLASVERLFKVLRLLDAEISLAGTASASDSNSPPRDATTDNASGRKRERAITAKKPLNRTMVSRTPKIALSTKKKLQPATPARPSRIGTITKKESW